MKFWFLDPLSHIRERSPVSYHRFESELLNQRSRTLAGTIMISSYATS
jgi:hypothetical protein